MRLFIIILSCLSVMNSLNVLIVSPTFATSHMTFFNSIADSLTDAGHNVTILAQIVDDRLRNHALSVKTEDVIFVEQDEIMKQELRNAQDPSKAKKALWTLVEDPSDMDENFQWMLDQLFTTCPNLMRSKVTLDELSARHFDVAITESLAVCGMGLFKKLGIERTILATSLAIFDSQFHLIGEPNHLSYVPTSDGASSDKMNILERYHNYRTAEASKKIAMKVLEGECKLLSSEWGISDCESFFPSASAYFVNSNPYLDFPRPVLQKTIQIGGINVDIEKIKSQKLPEEWDKMLNLRKRNMLISFGSIAKSMDMPIEWRENLLNVIRGLPEVTIIWKYESDDVQWAADVKNVKFVKWTPQTALLADKRVTAFLTHAGLGSTNELAHLGKPALMVPIFGDQMRNAHMLSRHNGSIYFDKSSLSDFDLLKDSIHKILYEDNYRKNAERLADILRNQPISPNEAVVKHVEFIGKYGPFPNMDPYGRKLSKIQLEMIDIFAIIYFSYALIIVVSLIILKLGYNYLRNQKLKKL